MKHSRISVLIPAYRPNLQYLKECLESIRKQDLYQPEIIIGLQSNEDISEMAKQFNAQIIKYKKPSLYQTRVDLIAKATHRFIWFVDCDDSIAPKSIDLLEKLIDQFPNNKLFVVGILKFATPKQIGLSASNEKYEKCDIKGIRDKFYKNEIENGIWAKIFDKGIAPSFPDIDIFMGEDAVFTNTIFNGPEDSGILINEPLYFYRLNPESGQTVPTFKHLTDLSLAIATIEKQNGNSAIALSQRLFTNWGNALFRIINTSSFTVELFDYIRNDPNITTFLKHIDGNKNDLWIKPSVKTRLYSKLLKKISSGNYKSSKRLVQLFLMLQKIKHH